MTIPFTMPTNPLYLVRIVAAELSPYLLAIAGLALALAVVAVRSASGLARSLYAVVAVEALLALALAAVPLAQLGTARERADAALHAAIAGEVASPTAPLAGDVRITRDVVFRTIGADTLRLDRYDPPTPGPHPGIVVIHGGAWSSGDKGQAGGTGDVGDTDRWLAQRGYLVYDIQYRLAPAATFPAQLEDVECALGHLRAHAPSDGLDQERVALLGRSAGAHLALLTAYRAARDAAPSGCERPATVKAVVSLYGPTDLVVGYRAPAIPDLISAQKVLREFLGGSPDEIPERYRDATPQFWLDRPVPATLLIHGEADQIVLSNQSRRLANALAAAGFPAGLLLLPWAGHGFDVVPFGLGGSLALTSIERFLASVLR